MIYLKRLGAWFAWGVIGSVVGFISTAIFTTLLILMFHFAWWEPVDWELVWQVVLHAARFMVALGWFLWVLFGVLLTTSAEGFDELVDGIVKLGKWINKW